MYFLLFYFYTLNAAEVIREGGKFSITCSTGASPVTTIFFDHGERSPREIVKIQNGVISKMGIASGNDIYADIRKSQNETEITISKLTTGNSGSYGCKLDFNTIQDPVHIRYIFSFIFVEGKGRSFVRAHSFPINIAFFPIYDW